MSDDAESCPHCDEPYPAISRQGPRPEESSPWEWEVPLALLVFGLLILVMHGFAVAGGRGGMGVLVSMALLLAVNIRLLRIVGDEAAAWLGGLTGAGHDPGAIENLAAAGWLVLWSPTADTPFVRLTPLAADRMAT
jgi:hypothetical protein